jgi:hypothetical protein
MIRRFSSLARAAALLLLLAAPAAVNASSAFGHTKRELSGATSALDSLLDAAAALTGGGATADATQAAPLREAAGGIVDAWATNPTLKIGRRLMKGEGVGSFLEEMTFGKELEQVFTNPIAAHTVINREWARF